MLHTYLFTVEGFLYWFSGRKWPVVLGLVKQVEEIFDKNIIGPKKYIALYDKYSRLLTDEAEKDRDEFLKGEATLGKFFW